MYKLPTYFLLIAISITVSNVLANGQRSVQSCGRTVTLAEPPQRAVSHDINLTEMMFALELQPQMAGYSGISGWQKLTPEFEKSAGKLPQLAERYPSMESLLAVGADLFFAGWNYGMHIGGPLTPSTLKDFGIEVYELTESCIHIMGKKPSSFDDVYNDIRNLGVLFNVEKRAKALIGKLQSEVESLRAITGKVKHPVSVFVYDSGKDTPLTAGKYAIPSAMIEAAGGINILNDLNSSWTRTNWESVTEHNPDVIIIVNYGNITAQEKIDFLSQHPALSKVKAIQEQCFVTLQYSEATPGVRNISATRKLAEAFHPALFNKALSINSVKPAKL